MHGAQPVPTVRSCVPGAEVAEATQVAFDRAEMWLEGGGRAMLSFTGILPRQWLAEGARRAIGALLFHIALPCRACDEC